MYHEKEIDWDENGRRLKVKLTCCDCTSCWHCNHMAEQASGPSYFCRLHDKEVYQYQEPCEDFR